jgi:hypothetical protein
LHKGIIVIKEKRNIVCDISSINDNQFFLHSSVKLPIESAMRIIVELFNESHSYCPGNQLQLLKYDQYQSTFVINDMDTLSESDKRLIKYEKSIRFQCFVIGFMCATDILNFN